VNSLLLNALRCLAALGLAAGSAVAADGEPAKDTPIARHGALQLVGTQLGDSLGRPVQLRGMSTHGLQWYGWPTKLTPSALDVLAKDWHADILRVAMYVDEGGYLMDKARYRGMVDALVDETKARGMYCLIDWHMLKPGDPNAHLAEAKAFFDAVSAAHGAKGHVLYEICNEPNGSDVTWEKIRRYAAEIIPVIRKNDPDGIIIVGTPAWSSFGISGGPSGQAILDQRLTGELAKGVMYAFHFYAADHTEYHRREFEKFAERLPVFVTEWGSQKASGDGGNDWKSTAEWLALLDRRKISWCNWNYSDDPRSGAVWKEGTMPAGPFADERLKEAGVEVKKRIKAGRE
jgi:endoglucanase